jgi:hypothetical protein
VPRRLGRLWRVLTKPGASQFRQYDSDLGRGHSHSDPPFVTSVDGLTAERHGREFEGDGSCDERSPAAVRRHPGFSFHFEVERVDDRAPECGRDLIEITVSTRIVRFEKPLGCGAVE